MRSRQRDGIAILFQDLELVHARAEHAHRQHLPPANAGRLAGQEFVRCISRGTTVPVEAAAERGAISVRWAQREGAGDREPGDRQTVRNGVLRKSSKVASARNEMREATIAAPPKGKPR
jgi:hypothetical protein